MDQTPGEKAAISESETDEGAVTVEVQTPRRNLLPRRPSARLLSRVARMVRR